MPARMRMLSWPALSSRLCPPEKSLDNLISRSPCLVVTAKACPDVRYLQCYLKVWICTFTLHVAWTIKVLVFQFRSDKCYLKSRKAERWKVHKYINEIMICWFVLCSLIMTVDATKAASVLFACRKLLLSHSRISSRPLNNGSNIWVKIYPYV